MPKILVEAKIAMNVDDDLNNSLEKGQDVAFDNLESMIAAKLLIPVEDVDVQDVSAAE